MTEPTVVQVENWRTPDRFRPEPGPLKQALHRPIRHTGRGLIRISSPGKGEQISVRGRW